MEQSEKKKFFMKQSVFILFVSLAICMVMFYSTGHAAWEFGIGTGISQMKIDGEMGFNTFAGPAKFDVKLDPEDINDLMDTAIGFGGYATDGTLLIQYAYGKLELEGRESTTLPGLNTLSARIGFDSTFAELTAGYPVYKSPSVIILADGGLRYKKHELDARLKLKDQSGAVIASRSRDFDYDWLDMVLGAIIKVPFWEKWSWNTRLNAGFGGSDGTYLASTGVTWRFHKNWSAGIKGEYLAVDYEHGSKGDSGWYLYDADESIVGLNVLFIF